MPCQRKSITISAQSAFKREPISASEIFTNVNSQGLQIPQDAPRLTYQSLASSTSFRLLQILSDGGQDILRCRMFNADLAAQETPQYITLSYTWHEKSLPKTFRPNFLQNYRKTTRERIIWIDQICINQDDKDECVQQIGQMCEIYQRASMDLFWIGEPDENTEAVMDLLVSLDRLETSLLASGLPRPGINALLNPIYMRSVGLPEYHAPIWASLMQFISRAAFQRAWIIQEVAVSQNPALFCRLAATFLAEISGAAGFITGMMNCHARHQQGEYQSLDLLLASTRRFKATKPVDKIFALINLAESGRREALPPSLRPDYRKSVVEVFRDVTLHLISQGSLDTLSGIEDVRFRHLHQLSSWVPDYSVHQVASILCMPPRPGSLTLYAAAVGRDVRLQYSPADPDILKLSAYKVDKISKICPMAEQTIQLTLENWANMIDFSAPYPSINGEAGSMIDAFWRTLIGNIDWTHKFAAFALQAREELRDADIVSPGGLNQDGELYECTMHHVSWYRRLFVTNGGYIGLAPPSAQLGDEVVLLSGGRVPFVVRKRNLNIQECYSIVGEAYVHGIMDGEL
ncbi:heterokaryon incompatibility protein-domain-containing protein [Fusarium redolens]|uniref:Heterokaryon incompatibility protein-domain-containing protein n=1 Tax=Fusarium redolens TaxID=48865 RepID=A0A9P9GS88_FUSRE|nr:heterokaryon incompatibility protein-domain-containing protein [Fusarium redolens]KAH7244510.1 heterokaryon incompatibility protein-domain-containing protein [Fusarium redolens]